MPSCSRILRRLRRVAIAACGLACLEAGAAPLPAADDPVESAVVELPLAATDGDMAEVDDGNAPDREQEIRREEEIREEEIQALVDAAVAARLGGIPRPRYIPATDLAPPKGLLLYKAAPRAFPFAVSLGGFLQLRWLEFIRTADSWTYSTGEPRPINNINIFTLNRFLISLSGHVVDERLVYSFAFFGTGNTGVRAGVVPIGMAGWKFDDAATVGIGVTQVPGSREWINASPWTIGVDRSMANTFFRPGFSPGAAAVGKLLDGKLFYEAGAWNAIDGGSSGVFRRGVSMAWAGNTWWEPWAPFGIGYGDMEHHDEAAIRLGTSGVYAKTYALGFLGQNPEDTIVRLSDGTPLVLPEALGPGSQVDRYRYQLATVDAGWKYAGWAANVEYYFRTLDDFTGTGTFLRSSMLDHGGLGYLSWCYVPRTFEIYGRSSVVTGPYGTGQEYGMGFNWYVNRSRQGRFTLEALNMVHNPAQNVLYPYRAGYSGTAIQTQFMCAF
jgi:hypothetical protein